MLIFAIIFVFLLLAVLADHRAIMEEVECDCGFMVEYEGWKSYYCCPYCGTVRKIRMI